MIYRIGTGDTPHGATVVAVVVVGIDLATIKVKVVSVGATVGRTRPVVAPLADIVKRATVDVPSIINTEPRKDKKFF